MRDELGIKINLSRMKKEELLQLNKYLHRLRKEWEIISPKMEFAFKQDSIGNYILYINDRGARYVLEQLVAWYSADDDFCRWLLAGSREVPDDSANPLMDM